MANTLGSGPWAHVLAASAASAAKCFHTEVWAGWPVPSMWKHFDAEGAETAQASAIAYEIFESPGPEIHI